MKTYVLTVSQTFPKYHKRAGEPTHFIQSIGNKTKLHTIRGNAKLWMERIRQVQAGEAELSIRTWSGQPYKSKQVEQFRLTADDGVGVQIIIMHYFRHRAIVGDRFIDGLTLAKNDGLFFADFFDWFKNHNFDEPLAVIHFTSMRY